MIKFKRLLLPLAETCLGLPRTVAMQFRFAELFLLHLALRLSSAASAAVGIQIRYVVLA